VVLSRQQVLIDAPLEVVWGLIGDPAGHRWCPGVRGESDCEPGPEQQVTKSFLGRESNAWIVERDRDLREMRVTCAEDGCWARWLLTDAQGGTFVDFEVGVEPKTAIGRIYTSTLGRRYYRRWLDESVEALRSAAATGSSRAG
jgi:hypothetical protein